MGTACCGNKDVNDKDANLSRKSRTKKKGGKNAPKIDENWSKDLPLFTVIKFQAIIRGYLARR